MLGGGRKRAKAAYTTLGGRPGDSGRRADGIGDKNDLATHGKSIHVVVVAYKVAPHPMTGEGSSPGFTSP